MFNHTLLYLDPGNSAIIAQVLAAVAGGYYVIKNHLISFFKKKNKPDNES